MKRLLLVVLGLTGLLAVTAPQPSAAQDEQAIELKLRLPGVNKVYVEPLPSGQPGGFRYRVETEEGTRSFTPEAFARLVYDQQQGRPFWKVLLNVTSPIGIAWVGLGLLGQLIFAGRLLVQWLTSEKRGRSVVPVVFWWMSLAGASMLLVYFVWRKDLVGVLGQSTGWFIYARNLHLIHTPREADAPG